MILDFVGPDTAKSYAFRGRMSFTIRTPASINDGINTPNEPYPAPFEG